MSVDGDEVTVRTETVRQTGEEEDDDAGSGVGAMRMTVQCSDSDPEREGIVGSGDAGS